MSKIIAFSDPHFHSWKNHSTLIGGMNSRLLDAMHSAKRVFDIARSNGIKTILVPGDIFEIRGNIKPSIFNPVTSMITDAVNSDLDIVVIPGNHDMEHFIDGENAIESWNNIKCSRYSTQCHVISKPGMVYSEASNIGIGGIPYIPSTEKFKGEFIRLQEIKPDYVMIHQGVDDFNDKGLFPETGLTARWLEENSRANCIILSGHYHHPNSNGRVVNVGALLQHNFGDEGSHRGCWIVNDGHSEFFPIPSPKFVSLDVDGTKWKKTSFSKSEIKGNFVKVKIRNLKDAEKAKKFCEDSGALSCVVEIEREFTPFHEYTIKVATPREMLSEFIEIIPKYKEKRDRILEMFDSVCIGA